MGVNYWLVERYVDHCTKVANHFILIYSSQDDILHQISRPALASIASHRQTVQTNQTQFSHSGRELFLTTGDGEVRILDYPSMVNRIGKVAISDLLINHSLSCTL